jgi:hypothetical protein
LSQQISEQIPKFFESRIGIDHSMFNFLKYALKSNTKAVGSAWRSFSN